MSPGSLVLAAIITVLKISSTSSSGAKISIRFLGIYGEIPVDYFVSVETLAIGHAHTWKIRNFEQRRATLDNMKG